MSLGHHSRVSLSSVFSELRSCLVLEPGSGPTVVSSPEAGESRAIDDVDRSKVQKAVPETQLGVSRVELTILISTEFDAISLPFVNPSLC